MYLLIKIFFALILIPLNLDQRGDITVAVAANFLLPMQDVVELYEDKYGQRVRLIAASSGVLTAQIKNGAPFDIFMSADLKYPQSLYEDGFSRQPPDVIVNGQIAFWSKVKHDNEELTDMLKKSIVKSIAIAQPELAPYGANVQRWMENHKVYDQLKSKLVYGENVGKINQLIFSGSVDAAFSSNSAMYSNQLKNVGNWVLPGGLDDTIPHGVILVRNRKSQRNPDVLSFYDFLFGPEAQQIFEEFGYLPPF